MTVHGRRAQSGYSSLDIMFGRSSAHRGQPDGVVPHERDHGLEPNARKSLQL